MMETLQTLILYGQVAKRTGQTGYYHADMAQALMDGELYFRMEVDTETLSWR